MGQCADLTLCLSPAYWIASTLNGRIITAFAVYLIAFFGVRTAHEIYTTYLYHRVAVTTRLQ